MSRADQIKQKARELGFDLVGITSAAPPPHAPAYRRWLADGFHGEMTYMGRKAEQRMEPTKVLPGARSIIVVGMNYNSASVVASVPDAHPQDPVAGTAATTPRIVRYAWGTGDYHDVIGPKLKELATLVNGIWYLDTGPILERDLAQRANVPDGP